MQRLSVLRRCQTVNLRGYRSRLERMAVERADDTRRVRCSTGGIVVVAVMPSSLASSLESAGQCRFLQGDRRVLRVVGSINDPSVK